MAFLLVNTTDEKTEEKLNAWYMGRKRSNIRKYFIRKLGTGTYLLDGNAIMLALLHDLRKRHKGNVYIYAVESLPDSEVPKKVKEVVERCQGERFLPKEELKGLEKIKIRCSVNLKESSSE